MLSSMKRLEFWIGFGLTLAAMLVSVTLAYGKLAEADAVNRTRIETLEQQYQKLDQKLDRILERLPLRATD